MVTSTKACMLLIYCSLACLNFLTTYFKLHSHNNTVFLLLPPRCSLLGEGNIVANQLLHMRKQTRDKMRNREGWCGGVGVNELSDRIHEKYLNRDCIIGGYK